MSGDDVLETVTDAVWDERVLAGGPPVLVDFSAPWCAPCITLEPAVRDIAARYAGRMRVATLNVDDEPRSAGRYDVLSLPTLILFVDGAPVARIGGAVKPARLEAAVAAHLPPTD